MENIKPLTLARFGNSVSNFAFRHEPYGFIYQSLWTTLNVFWWSKNSEHNILAFFSVTILAFGKGSVRRDYVVFIIFNVNVLCTYLLILMALLPGGSYLGGGGDM